LYTLLEMTIVASGHSMFS